MLENWSKWYAISTMTCYNNHDIFLDRWPLCQVLPYVWYTCKVKQLSPPTKVMKWLFLAICPNTSLYGILFTNNLLANEQTLVTLHVILYSRFIRWQSVETCLSCVLQLLKLLFKNMLNYIVFLLFI